MKITKIKIKNLLGVKEVNLDGSSVELSGTNGAGKTSVLDAIRYALTNKPTRDFIVRKGETEGEIIIETDNGLMIDRKSRIAQSDYKSIKQNGHEVASPEAFLRDIFTPLQLNPVEFMAMDKKQQNAIILDMIEYEWDMNTIRGWFGEIPDWVNYEQNILAILNDIQSESGQYYIDRQDINRDIRNTKAYIEDIANSLPVNYDAEKWRVANAGELYREIERINISNATLEKAKQIIENKNNKIRKFEADFEIEKAAIDREISSREIQIIEEITRLEGQISTLKQEQSGLLSKKADRLELAKQTYKANVAEFEAQCMEYAAYENSEPQDTLHLNQQAAEIEKMKSYINEYDKMRKLQQNVEKLTEKAKDLTYKIEKARILPGEILANCTIPIEGLSVKSGVPYIKGLPVSNLSEGEKLDLCVDVAIHKPNGLQIILLDGVEKLSTELKNTLYDKCRSKGLQFIATRTTDDNDLIITEL